MKMRPLKPARAARLRARRALALGALLLASTAGSGCLSVTLYQPQRAIHRPVLIERSETNFAGHRILLRCNSHEEYLPPEDASKLCSKLAEDLERQGAKTDYVVPVGARYIEPEVFEGKSPDLTIEIHSRIDHEHDYPATLILSIATLTMLPAVSEQTFTQRVVIYGRDRSVLVEETFQERFVEYAGLGVWSVNWVLDWLFRAKEDRISGDWGKKDFTEDFYGQLRQMAFNARMRSEVLGLTDPDDIAATAAADEEEEKNKDKKKKKKKKKRRKKKKKKRRKKKKKEKSARRERPSDLPGLGDPADAPDDK